MEAGTPIHPECTVQTADQDLLNAVQIVIRRQSDGAMAIGRLTRQSTLEPAILSRFTLRKCATNATARPVPVAQLPSLHAGPAFPPTLTV
jgi:hypothetical protein